MRFYTCWGEAFNFSIIFQICIHPCLSYFHVCIHTVQLYTLSASLLPVIFYVCIHFFSILCISCATIIFHFISCPHHSYPPYSISASVIFHHMYSTSSSFLFLSHSFSESILFIIDHICILSLIPSPRLFFS